MRPYCVAAVSFGGTVSRGEFEKKSRRLSSKALLQSLRASHSVRCHLPLLPRVSLVLLNSAELIALRIHVYCSELRNGPVCPQSSTSSWPHLPGNLSFYDIPVTTHLPQSAREVGVYFPADELHKRKQTVSALPRRDRCPLSMSDTSLVRACAWSLVACSFNACRLSETPSTSATVADRPFD